MKGCSYAWTRSQFSAATAPPPALIVALTGLKLTAKLACYRCHLGGANPLRLPLEPQEGTDNNFFLFFALCAIVQPSSSLSALEFLPTCPHVRF